MRNIGIVGVIALVVVGGIVSDVWRHPQGTQAAGNGLAQLWTPSLQAVSGQSVSGAKAA